MPNNEAQAKVSWKEKVLDRINQDWVIIKWALQRAWEIDSRKWTSFQLIFG